MKRIHVPSSSDHDLADLGTRRPLARRDFLGWLAAVPALHAIGCAVDHHDPDEDALDVEQAAGVCKPTTRDAEGPYFAAGSPVRTTRLAALDEPGVPLLVEGRILGPGCNTPLAGYMLDIWQADDAGEYHDAGATGFRLRGKIITDAQGRYRFETILPGRYGDAEGIRPAHLHAKVRTPLGYTLLTTQIYFAGDPYLGAADYCTVDGTCNSADPARALVLSNALVSGRSGKRATFEAKLVRT